MTDNKITDLIIRMTSELSSLNANMKSVLDKLSSHEQRITNLEQNKSTIKDTTIQWLIKGIIASVFVIGSLTGAGSLLKGIFGV